MQEIIVRLKEFALNQGTEIAVAIAILIIGWVVALLGAMLVRAEAISQAAGRIRQIAYDIAEHYVANWQGTGYKAQLASTQMFYDPADAVAFTSSDALKDTMVNVAEFL